MRILLVDDEPAVLMALSRVLSQLGEDEDWEVATARNGADALDALERGPFGVVVTDLRMPGMSGLDLLRTVTRRWPETVRIILSGSTDAAATTAGAAVAHQFLAKPASGEALTRAIQGAADFAGAIRDDGLRAALGGQVTLPPAPVAWLRLRQVLDDPRCGPAEIAQVIGTDPGLIVRVLQLANSAVFCRGRPVTALPGAVSRLGSRNIEAAILLSETQPPPGPLAAGAAALWADGERAAALVAATGRCCADVVTAALLSPVGLLALATARPDLLGRILAARGGGEPADVVDQAVLGMSRHVLSAAVLAAWGIPEAVLAPLRHLDAPHLAPEPMRLGAALLHRAVGSTSGRTVDLDCLAQLGISPPLAEAFSP